jgi:hypothetical protein
VIAAPDLPRATQAQPRLELPSDPHLPSPPSLEELEDLEPEEEPAPRRANVPPPPPPPPPPKYAGLLRILFPLIFILIPLFNLLVRNSPFASDAKPVLQETQFFENFSDGRFSDPQTVFSVSRHERVVLVARWSGSRGRHEYVFRWHTPDGKVLPMNSSVTRFQFGGEDDVFSTYALLPLKPDLPLGTWRVEVIVDGEVLAQPTFELRE